MLLQVSTLLLQSCWLSVKNLDFAPIYLEKKKICQVLVKSKQILGWHTKSSIIQHPTVGSQMFNTLRVKW